MKHIDVYNNLLLELDMMKSRIKTITEYEKYLFSEKQNLNNLINIQTKTIKKIEKDLQELSGIENKLYREIVINGNSVSKAIDIVSTEENKDVSTLWKNYYPKIKKKIQELSIIEK